MAKTNLVEAVRERQAKRDNPNLFTPWPSERICGVSNTQINSDQLLDQLGPPHKKRAGWGPFSDPCANRFAVLEAK